MLRKEQKTEDTWNLESIFKTEDDFNNAIKTATELCQKIEADKGKLLDENVLLQNLKLQDDFGIITEKIGSYSFMRFSQDGSDKENLKIFSTAQIVLSKFTEKLSFINVEILAMTEDKLKNIIANPLFEDYKVCLTKLLRQKKYILSQECEDIFAKYTAASGSSSSCFDSLTDVDFKFPNVYGKKLTQSTYSLFLHSKCSFVRKKAYNKFYSVFDSHKHTIAKMYESNVKENVFLTSSRGYENTLSAKLYANDVPLSVYTNLIEAAHNGFDLLHKFYDIKRKRLGIKKLNHWDVYAPIFKQKSKKTPYNDAVNIVSDALKPLGSDYVSVLKEGLTTARWVDRYENKGKSSGAYSNGCYKTLPFILLNYNEGDIRDIFTIAHEGGHSMHSYYSAKNNPFSCYNYSIFEAETASTFNERLLSDYLIKNTKSEKEKLYLLSKEADDIVATFFRQTMFAEFEYKVFKRYEEGGTITLDELLQIYSELLTSYFGKDVNIPKIGALECLRIPHFYRPFYVYKYATGISAAQILSQKVLQGGDKEREDYLGFLKRGGTLFPLENLKRAGADLTDIHSFDMLLDRFKWILGEIDA